ncbi:MAG: insulinase family protein, partial [Thermodesulfatator sp.]
MPVITKIILVGIMALALTLISKSAQTQNHAPGLTIQVLDNGLTAVVKEAHRAPVAAVQVWVKAGSAYETDAQAGITHLIEHMIFKGTEKRGPGELARTIESLGGTINAYTSYDYTVYHCVVPSSHLNTALDILEDAVFHSKFDPSELEREKKVVLEEMRMREDRPRVMLFEDLMKISYSRYPYMRPIIGNEKTVMSFTRSDILAYMAQRYRPCNISVVVAGDVDTQKAVAMIGQYFGKETKASCDSPGFPEEPVQNSPRHSLRKMECQEGYLAISFSGIPGFNSADVPALDLLAAYLSHGESSYLVSTLKNQLQLVHSVSASAFTPMGPGLFEITANIDPDKAEAVLSKTFSLLFGLKESQISQKELRKAKTQVLTDFIFSQETMEGEARKLGVFQTLAGDANKEQEYLEKVRQVTTADIQAVSRKYFRADAINVAMVIPEKEKVSIDEKKLSNIIMEAEIAASAAKLPPDENIAVKNVVRKFILANGATILALEAHDLPTVAVRIVFPGGLRYETPDNNGIFNLLARTWNKGTSLHDADAISDITDSLGATISGFSGQNSFGLQGRFTSDSFKKGLGLLMEVLLSPTFPKEEVEKQKPLILARIRQQDDYLPGVAIREFRKLLFSPHPYGMNVLGTPETVTRLDSHDLKQLYNAFAVPDRAIISVVGDIDADELYQNLDTQLKSWQNESTLFLPTPPAPEPVTAPKMVSLHRERQQEHIVLGFMGPGLTSPDRYPLEVLNAILSGQGGRLFTDLRDKKSLAYSVTSFTGFGIDYGSIASYIACAPEK